MEKLTRLCKDTENGKYIPYVAGDFIGIYPDCILGKVVERLAAYEDTDLTPEEFKESVDFTLELNKKVKKVVADLKYYLDTNEENGVVYIPKFIIEKMVNEHLKTNF